jgi:multimeric flavodoxin WrbA
MKVLAINGSHRPRKNTATMLKLAMEEVESAGGEASLIELAECKIDLCKACNKCLSRSECIIKTDDMASIAEKMLAADAILIGSPVYFFNVTSLMKIFIDRTRWMHMYKDLLEGKIGGALTHAGLRNGGQETTQIILERFLQSHGLSIVNTREPSSGIYNIGPLGTMFDSVDNGNISWKKDVMEDQLAVMLCRSLGRNIVRKLRERDCTPSP